MRCFHCWEREPFWGEKCDHCGMEKSFAQSVRILSSVILLACTLFGAWRWDFEGFLVGGALGGLIFLALEGGIEYWGLRKKRKKKE